MNLVTAADESYALPLAVMVRSVLDHLASDQRIRLYVLDGGIAAPTKQRLADSWNDPRLTVTWVAAPAAELTDLYVSSHVNHVTYFRILMPRLLPAEVSRAIYLDSDVLVRRDLQALWAQESADVGVLAAVDAASPRVDASLGGPRAKSYAHFLVAAEPIANYRELNLAGDAPYFNGGVLVVNVERWRRDRLSERMLDCLRVHREHVRWWDQYALNVVLAGNWRQVDPRWNQGSHIYSYPSWNESPFDRATFEALQRDPWIVHFTSQQKPWHFYNSHPFRGEFLATLDRTAWQGWRPAPPDRERLRQWWRHHWAPMRRWVRIWRSRLQTLAASPQALPLAGEMRDAATKRQAA